MLQVWSTEAYERVHEFCGHVDEVTGLLVHRSEPLLISGSRDKSIRLWRLDTFKLVSMQSSVEPDWGQWMRHWQCGGQSCLQTRTQFRNPFGKCSENQRIASNWCSCKALQKPTKVGCLRQEEDFSKCLREPKHRNTATQCMKRSQFQCEQCCLKFHAILVNEFSLQRVVDVDSAFPNLRRPFCVLSQQQRIDVNEPVEQLWTFNAREIAYQTPCDIHVARLNVVRSLLPVPH